MTDSDTKFMSLALEQARMALRNNWIPVGALFVKDGRIVANGTKTGMVHVLFDHAEHNGCYQALWSREGPKNLSGFTVYTTLEPCLMCLSMLMTTRVSRIVYACRDPYGGGTRILENPAVLPPRFQDERPAVQGGLLEDESKRLLRQFFSELKDSANWSNPNNALVKYVQEE